MRILHFADLHLGVENYSGGINPQDGLSWRLHDFLATLDEVVEFALKENIDLVLFCGDAYKSRDPSQTHQREFAKRIWKLSSRGVSVFLLTGNHDLPNAFGRATALEIFRTLEIPNVTVASSLGTYQVQTKAGTLQVVALPWAKKSAILSRDDEKGLTFDEINEKLEQMLTDRLRAEIETLDRDMPAILAAHVSLANAKPGSERGMLIGRDYVLLPSAVHDSAFSYVALGHVHSKQVLSYSDPPMAYSGSLQRIDFSEEDDEKGFFIVEIGQKGPTTFQFCPVKARPFLTLKLDLSRGELDPTQEVLRAIARHESKIKGAIVRLQITIPDTLDGLFQEGEVRKALKEAHFVAAIARNVERERRPRMPGWSAEAVTPLEALKCYLSTKKTSVEPQVVLEYGEKLIQESRIE